MNKNPITSLNTGGIKNLGDGPTGDAPGTPEGDDGGGAGQQPPPQNQPEQQPWLGIFAVIFGTISVFAWSVLFVPLALFLGAVCLFRGMPGWGIGAILLAVVGFLTSPMLLIMVGLSALAAYFGMPLDMMGGPGGMMGI